MHGSDQPKRPAAAEANDEAKTRKTLRNPGLQQTAADSEDVRMETDQTDQTVKPARPPVDAAANNSAAEVRASRILAVVHDLLRLSDTTQPGHDGYAVAHQPVRVLFAMARALVDHPEGVLHPVR